MVSGDPRPQIRSLITKKVGTRSYVMIMETPSNPVTNRGMIIYRLHRSTLTYQLRNDK